MSDIPVTIASTCATQRNRPVRTILIAPDSFKGTLSAAAAAKAIGQGVRRVLPDAKIIIHPVSDGGEGMLDVLLPALGGREMTAHVSGPLPGSMVTARWGLSGDDRTAVIEMAEASGLMLVPVEKRDPRITTTYGVGELVRAALEYNVERIIVGIGGSATNDGGSGFASALGVKFLDHGGSLLPQGGASLINLASVSLEKLDPRIAGTNFMIACDVTNPLTGPAGASRMYGMQKGGNQADVAMLDAALTRYGELLRVATGKDVAAVPGSGAGGGLAAGLLAFCNAAIAPGIDLVLDATGFDGHLARADLVITGEGKIDMQTGYGKALGGILRRGRAAGVPVVAVVGTVAGTVESFLGRDGFHAIATMAAGSTSTEIAMRQAARVLEERTAELLSMTVPADP